MLTKMHGDSRLRCCLSTSDEGASAAGSFRPLIERPPRQNHNGMAIHQFVLDAFVFSLLQEA
jgi:hypothetical protein